MVAKTLRDPRLPKGFRFEVLGEAATPGRLTRPGAKAALKALERPQPKAAAPGNTPPW
ncbi:MAG: hypothetical protein WDO13_16040 [Verrucomicrobiota bacterium]